MSSDGSTRGSISVRGVRKSFPGTDRPALDGVDLQVEAGRVCALLGRVHATHMVDYLGG